MAAAAMINLISVFQASWISWRYRDKVQWRDMLFMCIGYFILSTIALRFGVRLKNDVLKMMLGCLLVVLSIYFLFIAGRVRIRPNGRNGLVFGGLGGIMSSLFATGGPPAGLYFSSAYDDKEAYLATIQSYFMITNIYVTFLRAVNGIITKEVLSCAVFGLAGMAVGTFIGKKIFDRIHAATIRKIIYVMMAVSGIIMIAETSLIN